jgi:hypothetical protein
MENQLLKYSTKKCVKDENIHLDLLVGTIISIVQILLALTGFELMKNTWYHSGFQANLAAQLVLNLGLSLLTLISAQLFQEFDPRRVHIYYIVLDIGLILVNTIFTIMFISNASSLGHEITSYNMLYIIFSITIIALSLYCFVRAIIKKIIYRAN